MESQRIKENRREKFLSKMEKRNNNNNCRSNNLSSFISNTSPITKDYPSIFQFSGVNNQKKCNYLNNNPNLSSFTGNNNSYFNSFNQNHFTNNSVNNQIKFNHNNNKVNYSEIIEKINQFDYMINFQSIIKKILLIILTLFHCWNYPPLEDTFVFKYTFIILELTSLFFNKYYNDRKKEISKNGFNNYDNGKSSDEIGKIDLIFNYLIKYFGIFNHIFVIINFVNDFILDLSIIFIINILFFLKNQD